MKPKIFSFFAGCGFLDLGFETSNYEIVYVNEIYSPFIVAYRHSRAILNLPSPEYGYHEGEKGDVRKLIEESQFKQLQELVNDCRNFADIIGFIGGPPCPDFAIGGKNLGCLGDNGKLSAAYVELICQQKPDFFVFENVKGLWRTKKHRFFYESLKTKLQETGYILTENLINAIEYGVPQNRERIILIGFYRSLNNLNLTNRDFQKTWAKHTLYSQKQVFAYPWSPCERFQENSISTCPNEIPQELTVEHWFRKNNVLNHPNSQHYFQPRAGIQKFMSIPEGDDSKKSFKRLHRWRYSPTACYGNNEVHLHPYKARRISAAEALAIQSLPVNFSLPDNMSLTNMFKTIGNGVPYLASKAIAQTISDVITR